MERDPHKLIDGARMIGGGGPWTRMSILAAKAVTCADQARRASAAGAGRARESLAGTVK